MEKAQGKKAVAESKQASTDTRDKRLLGYTLAAGATALGFAQTSEAAVVYSGPQNIDIGLLSSQNLNLDGDAYNDILLKNYLFGGGPYQGAYVNFAPGKLVGFISGFGYASALSENDLIDASTTAGGPFQASLAYGSNNPNAEFNSVTGAFIGLEFAINATSHFGWIRVDIDNANGTFNIVDWAYNDTPGEGILAGEVPEPTTLGLLAAGAAGLGLRRRRQTA